MTDRERLLARRALREAIAVMDGVKYKLKVWLESLDDSASET